MYHTTRSTRADIHLNQLWMGTHHSSPARLLSGETLASHLAAHKELIGERVATKFANAGAGEGNLPFLLKVLAIAKALKIGRAHV